MLIATWNVNSIRTRVGRVVDWMTRNNVDVLAMQEIKCRPDQFPVKEFEAAGYKLEILGYNQWNGVAFASRHEMTEVSREVDGMPGFGKVITGADQPLDEAGLPHEARALGVTIGDLRLWNLYVPNGRSLDDAHYDYKLRWLRALREHAADWLAENEDGALAMMGDWNVAPLEGDMGDPTFVVGKSTHVSPAEREMIASFEEYLTDPVRELVPEGYTFWDYKAGRFQKDEGMRIDFIFGSEAFNRTVKNAKIDRDERRGDGPSDHVPVVVEIDTSLLEESFADDYDRPMVF